MAASPRGLVQGRCCAPPQSPHQTGCSPHFSCPPVLSPSCLTGYINHSLSVFHTKDFQHPVKMDSSENITECRFAPPHPLLVPSELPTPDLRSFPTAGTGTTATLWTTTSRSSSGSSWPSAWPSSSSSRWAGTGGALLPGPQPPRAPAQPA